MELYRPRSSSIPRHLRQIPVHERFTVTHAAQLKFQLQTLNNHLESQAPISLLKETCQSRPFHEAIYVSGSEEFFLLVKAISRPDLIPHVYLDAYMAVQHGRFPTNRYTVSDFRKAKPFPFLSLPAELRLHIYSHLLPREAYLAILHLPPSDHKPPKIKLDIMRTNHQVYHEVIKYFFENRTLYMSAARDKSSVNLSDEYISHYYETISSIGPCTRSLFRKLEIYIGFLSHQTFIPRKHQHVISMSDPIHEILDLLPNLDVIIISSTCLPLVFDKPQTRALQTFARIVTQKIETVEWLLGSIRPEIEVRWAIPGAMDDGLENVKIQQLMAIRGPLLYAESMLSHFEKT